MKWGIEVVINILVVTALHIDFAKLFTLWFVCLHFTISLSSHPDFAFISNERLFLFYLLRVISTTGQLFFSHYDLVSYQDRLRNTKEN